MFKRAADSRLEKEKKKQSKKMMKRLEYCMICRHTTDLGEDDEKLICRGCPAIAHPDCAVGG